MRELEQPKRTVSTGVLCGAAEAAAAAAVAAAAATSVAAASRSASSESCRFILGISINCYNKTQSSCIIIMNCCAKYEHYCIFDELVLLLSSKQGPVCMCKHDCTCRTCIAAAAAASAAAASAAATCSCSAAKTCAAAPSTISRALIANTRRAFLRRMPRARCTQCLGFTQTHCGWLLCRCATKRESRCLSRGRTTMSSLSKVWQAGFAAHRMG